MFYARENHLALSDRVYEQIKNKINDWKWVFVFNHLYERDDFQSDLWVVNDDVK